MKYAPSKREKEIYRIRRNIRDSVFQAVIKKPKYLREIYLSLHPEDEEIKEEDLRIIRTEPVFIGGALHDCCFSVRDEKVIFIEVQSTLCRLLPERMIRYYAGSIDLINKGFKERQYTKEGMKILTPEFWVIHVGDNPSSAIEFYRRDFVDDELYIPLRVKTEYNTDGFLKEYCLFSSIYRKNQDNEKMTREEIIKATMKECLEKGIMREFLSEHEEEVRKIMSETNEYYFRKYVECERNDALAEGKAEGEAIGEARGAVRGRANERKAGLSSLEKTLKAKGFTPLEAKSFIKEYLANLQ